MKLMLIVLGLGLVVCNLAYADGDKVAIETIVLEAGGESLDGQIAVGEVIRNRTDDVYTHGSYADRVDQVVRRPWQFSCWNNPLIAKLRLSRVSGEAYQRASKAWEASRTSDLTGGATHYANLSLCSPKWARKLKQTVKIGAHTFYAEA